MAFKDFLDKFGKKTAEAAKVSGEKAAELAKVGGAKAAELAKAGSAKARQLAEITKLKAANIAQEEIARKAYLAIGKLYYEKNAATAEDEFAELCGKVTAAKAAVEANLAKIEELKLEATPDDETLVDQAQLSETEPDAKAEAAAQVETAAQEVQEAVGQVEAAAEQATPDL